MTKRIAVVIFGFAFLVAAFAPEVALRAEDEDLNSTVYMVFDPETGELIMVDESAKAPRKHGAPDAAPTQGTADSAAASAQSGSVPLLLGGAVVAGLLGGAIALLRKRRQSP